MAERSQHSRRRAARGTPTGPGLVVLMTRIRRRRFPAVWPAALPSSIGVGERSVYRHFPTKRLLHDAVMQRLEEEADITYETFALANLADVTTRGVRRRRLLRGPGKRQRAGQSDVRGRRRAPPIPHWSGAQRGTVAALLDVLWNLPSYERLVGVWNLDSANATNAITWLISKV
jgi:AcrR family transcriptional regulator